MHHRSLQPLALQAPAFASMPKEEWPVRHLDLLPYTCMQACRRTHTSQDPRPPGHCSLVGESLRRYNGVPQNACKAANSSLLAGSRRLTCAWELRAHGVAAGAVVPQHRVGRAQRYSAAQLRVARLQHPACAHEISERAQLRAEYLCRCFTRSIVASAGESASFRSPTGCHG